MLLALGQELVVMTNNYSWMKWRDFWGNDGDGTMNGEGGRKEVGKVMSVAVFPLGRSQWILSLGLDGFSWEIQQCRDLPGILHLHIVFFHTQLNNSWMLRSGITRHGLYPCLVCGQFWTPVLLRQWRFCLSPLHGGFRLGAIIVVYVTRRGDLSLK